MSYADYYNQASKASKTPNQLAAQKRAQFDDRSMIGLNGRQRAMYDMLAQDGDYTKANAFAGKMQRGGRIPTVGGGYSLPQPVQQFPPMVPYNGQMQGNFTTGPSSFPGWWGNRAQQPQRIGYAAGIAGKPPALGAIGNQLAAAQAGQPRMTYQQYLRLKQQFPNMQMPQLGGADFLFGGYQPPSGPAGNPYLPAQQPRNVLY